MRYFWCALSNSVSVRFSFRSQIAGTCTNDVATDHRQRVGRHAETQSARQQLDHDPRAHGMPAAGAGGTDLPRVAGLS